MSKAPCRRPCSAANRAATSSWTRLAGHGVPQDVCLSSMVGCLVRSSAAICYWIRPSRISISPARRCTSARWSSPSARLGVLSRHWVPPDPGQGRADPGAACRVLPLGFHPVPARIAYLRDQRSARLRPVLLLPVRVLHQSRRWRDPRTSLNAGSPSSPGSCRGCSSGSRSAVVLQSKLHGPNVPFSGGVSILTHKPGNAAIAALLALGFMWLFPETRSARSRALWSIVALVVIALRPPRTAAACSARRRAQWSGSRSSPLGTGCG